MPWFEASVAGVDTKSASRGCATDWTSMEWFTTVRSAAGGSAAICTVMRSRGLVAVKVNRRLHA